MLCSLKAEKGAKEMIKQLITGEMVMEHEPCSGKILTNKELEKDLEEDLKSFYRFIPSLNCQKIMESIDEWDSNFSFDPNKQKIKCKSLR